jgi:hypothetical protein
MIAETMFHRMRGLMNRPDWKGGMLLPTKSIHTFFMKQNLDVFFLDRRGKVVYAVLDLKPCRISPVIRKAKMVLEVPSGALGELMIGHYIELPDNKRRSFTTCLK